MKGNGESKWEKKVVSQQAYWIAQSSEERKKNTAYNTNYPTTMSSRAQRKAVQLTK